MSVVEKLEEAIYKKRWKVPDGLGLGKIEVVSLSDFQREFVAFKKDYASKIHVPRKLLEDILYNLKQEPEAYCDEIRVLEELLGVEKTK